METTIKNGWSYRHEIGVISVAGWGDPFLVVTEHAFWDGRSNGYNYRALGISYKDETLAKENAAALNKTLGLPRIFTPEASEALLLKLQADFPDAEIAKK